MKGGSLAGYILGHDCEFIINEFVLQGCASHGNSVLHVHAVHVLQYFASHGSNTWIVLPLGLICQTSGHVVLSGLLVWPRHQNIVLWG